MFFGPGATETFVKLRKLSNAAVASKPFTQAQPINLSDLNTKDQFQIICFENNNAAFFADTVVLVEGDSDYLLMPHVARTLDPSWDVAKVPVQFARITGKGNIRRYREFFTLFDVRVPVIADLDLLVNGFDHVAPDNAMKVASGQAGAVRPMPVIESVLANLFGGDRDVGAAVEESMGRAQGEAPYNPSSALVRSIAGGVAAKVRGTAMLDSLVRSPGGRFLEAGARGIQEATGTLSDDPVSKAAGAVTQGGMSMAEMLVPVPGYFWGSFFLQGAGSGAQEFEQAYEAGDVKGEQFSRTRQYAAAGIQGGIETVTEGVGGLIEMGFAKTVAGEFMERYAKRSLSKSIAVGLAGSMATEGAEEGIGSLATEYGRKPVAGERQEELPDALLNALSDAGYGSLGGVSGHAVGVAASVAQRKAQNEFISKALKERNSVYADPKFWEGIPGTTAAAISAMTPEERAAEIDARRSSSLKARGDIQAHELVAERIGTELADAERRLKAAKKRKDAKAEEEATNSIADLRRQGEEWGKDMAELRADREASDIAYHTAVAVAAREDRGWKPRTAEESLVENGAQATEPVTKGDMLVLDELTKLGYEVTFYGGDGSKDRTGYYDPSVPNRIFVRSGLEGASARLMIGSAYHEIIHAIQFTDARLWDAIRSSFDEQSLIASAVDYFRSGAEPEDFAAMAAAKDAVDYANEAAKAGSRARLPPGYRSVVFCTAWRTRDRRCVSVNLI